MEVSSDVSNSWSWQLYSTDQQPLSGQRPWCVLVLVENMRFSKPKLLDGKLTFAKVRACTSRISQKNCPILATTSFSTGSVKTISLTENHNSWQCQDHITY
jgi:hypothetical protein